MFYVQWNVLFAQSLLETLPASWTGSIYLLPQHISVHKQRTALHSAAVQTALNTPPSSVEFAISYRETCWSVTSAFPVPKTATSARDIFFCLRLLVHKTVLQLSGVRPLCGSPSVSCPANRRQALPLDFSRQHQWCQHMKHLFKTAYHFFSFDEGIKIIIFIIPSNRPPCDFY